jgi:hypothetical protein
VAFGPGHFLHHGRFHTHFAGDRYRGYIVEGD